MLSILHVVDSLERGGLERLVVDLATAQRDRGHCVSVFSINSTVGLLPELQAAGVPVVVGGKSRTLDVNVLGKLRRTATEKRVSIVHAHNFVPNYYAAAALIGSRPGPTLVGTCHDMGTRLSNTKLRWMYRLSLLRTRRVAMVGKQVHDHYVASGLVKPSLAEVVMNAVRVSRFAGSAHRRRAARLMLEVPDDVPVIGCVGRLVPLKNQQLLIKCMPTLLKFHPTLRLVMVGDGPLADELREQASASNVAGHVRFMGQRSDVADLLPAFDILALPSLTEGLSIALLEACATGLAVVATAVGGNPEVIQHNKTGLLIAPQDCDALNDALKRLLDDPALRGRLGSNAGEWVAAHRSIEALCLHYEGFYQRAG